jgi:hypothetical protein
MQRLADIPTLSNAACAAPIGPGMHTVIQDFKEINMFIVGILFERAGQCIYSAFKAAAARRAIRPLLAVEERFLRDIGITRADVIDCLSSPLADDPSELLKARRGRPQITHRSVHQVNRQIEHQVEHDVERLTFVDHPARWRAERSQSRLPARIDREAA